MTSLALGSEQENIVTVTAEYREAKITDTAFSVSVLADDVIKDAGEQHLEELLNLIPNINWAGGTSRPRYFQIRGVGERSQYEGAPNPSVGIMIDDIDFSGIGMVATLFDTQQIEVLRGPQSSRYGANALAGLINIKTNDPKIDNQLSTQFLLAEDNNWSSAMSLTGALNEDESVTGLFSLQQFQADGFRHNSFFNVDDTNERDEFTSRGKIHWQITDNLKLATTAILIDLNNGYDSWAIDNSLTTLSDKPGRDSQRSVAGSARFTLDMPSLQFISISTFADSDIEHSFDGDWGNDDSWGVNGPYDFTSDTARDRATWSQEFRLLSNDDAANNQSSASQKSIDWLVGLYILDLEEDNDIVELFNGFLYRDLGSTYNATNSAVFGELTQHFSSHTDLTVGLRFERRDADYSDSSGLNFSPTDNMIGGNITLRHYLDSGIMTWTSISRGYKAGGFNLSLSVPEAFREYDPEFLINYEAGLKGRFLDQKLLLSASLFYMDRKDMQISTSDQIDPTDPLTFIFLVDNAASGYNKGLETDVQYQLTDDWKIDASLGILSTTVQSLEGVDQTIVGRAQAHAPSYNFSLATEYRNQQGWFGRLSIDGKDDFYYSNSHQQKSTAYQLINIKLGYEAEQWSVYLWGKNIADEKYFVRGFFFANEPPNWEDKLYTNQGNPRQFGVTARFIF
ncbi:MAG: iron complex outermembrane receptor protein [Enterobacterales bacterium]|jgi:iron complex outermembrane receptor protein